MHASEKFCCGVLQEGQRILTSLAQFRYHGPQEVRSKQKPHGAEVISHDSRSSYLFGRVCCTRPWPKVDTDLVRPLNVDAEVDSRELDLGHTQ